MSASPSQVGPRLRSGALARWRWGVPVGLAGLVAAAVALPGAASAAPPKLPVLSAADLLAAVAQAKINGFSGVVHTVTDLGLPPLSGLVAGSGSTAAPTALISGSHDLRVWSAGTDNERVEIDATQAEYDVVRRGPDVWTYDAQTDAVTHRSLPSGAATRAGETGGGPQPAGALADRTPQQVAQDVLAAAGPSTEVSVFDNARVAKRPVYTLLVVPRAPQSLIGSVRIAVDSATKVPLRVQVFARGAARPALEVGFSTVELTAPPARVFATPTGHATPTAPGRPGRNRGSGAAPDGDTASAPGTAGPATPPTTAVVGAGWTSVLTLAGVPVDGRVRNLLGQATEPVTVAGVGAHLFRSALLSVLVCDDGRVYLGAVTPDTLTGLAAARR